MLIYPRWKSCVKIRSCGVGEALSKAFKKQAFRLLVFTLKGRQEPLSPLISSPPLFLTITFSTPPYSGIWQKLNSCNKLWGKQSSPVLLSSSEKKLGGFLLSLFLTSSASVRSVQAGGGMFARRDGCTVWSLPSRWDGNWVCNNFERCSLHDGNSLELFSLQNRADKLSTCRKQSPPRALLSPYGTHQLLCFWRVRDRVSLLVAFLDYWIQIFLYAYPLLVFVLCKDDCNDMAFGLSSFTWYLKSVNVSEIFLSKLLTFLCHFYV